MGHPSALSHLGNAPCRYVTPRKRRDGRRAAEPTRDPRNAPGAKSPEAARLRGGGGPEARARAQRPPRLPPRPPAPPRAQRPPRAGPTGRARHVSGLRQASLHGEGRPGPAPLPAALGSAGRSRRLCPRHGAPACWGARRRPDRAAPAVPGSWIAPQGRPRPRQSAGKMAAWSRNSAVNCSTSKPKFDILLQTVTSGVGTRRRGRRSPAPASG